MTGMLEQKMIPPIATKKELEEALRLFKRMIGGITKCKYSMLAGWFSTFVGKIDSVFCRNMKFRYFVTFWLVEIFVAF